MSETDQINEWVYLNEMKEVKFCNTRIRANRLGVVERFFKKGNNQFCECSKNKWTIIKNCNNTHNGYNKFEIDRTMIRRHRLIMSIFNPKFNINDSLQQIDHINHDRLDNRLENLRVVNNQQNCCNAKNTNGCYFNNRYQKWNSQITENKIRKHIGLFPTKEEAHEAYLIEANKRYKRVFGDI